MKLSHSKVQKYVQCPRMYDLHYNKKIRSKVLNINLVFGSALDDALNSLLLKKKKNRTEQEEEISKKDPIDVFIHKMTTINHNGEDIQVRTYPDVEYSKADLDESILTEDDKKDDHKAWASLKRKGIMIIEAYQKEVMPLIHEVYEVQKTISLPNQEGDEITGLIDFIASFTDDPATKYVCDNKTASKAYKESDLVDSEQLHTYAEAEGLLHIAYVVMEKIIRKKDPRVRITIMKGSIVPSTTEKVFDNYEKVLHNIKNEEFNPNYQSGCFFFGKPCPYHSLCHKDSLGNKLIKVGDK